MKALQKFFAIACISILTLTSLNSLSQAQDAGKDLGIGFMVGEPTGLSIKSWFNTQNALDAGLAWSFGRYDAVNLHADYLWHNYEAFNRVDTGTLTLYYGVGGRLVLGDDSLLGARIPVGLNYLLENDPIGFFFEVAPILNLAPSTDFDVDGGIGVRFYL